jgi:hypothetical protein
VRTSSPKVRTSFVIWFVRPLIAPACYSFIALCLVSFSVITIVIAETLASGSTLARASCAFFALFWTLRLLVATCVFDMRPYLTNTAQSRRLSRAEHRLHLPASGDGLAASRP